MSVKVVTDSTADIPPDILRELDISVVPIYVVFGDKSYRDRLDIGEDEFYHRLSLNGVFPTTAVPSPRDFAAVYDRLAAETDEIISIHLTSKESGIYNSAVLAKDMVQKKCRIEVIDSRTISMSYGLLAMAAAREARAGAGLDQVAEMVRSAVPRVHLLFMVDTLKYVVRGGRVSRTTGALGSVLGVKPLLTLKDGHLTLSTVARTRNRAIERLYDFARLFPRVKELAVPYTTERAEAESLASRLKSAFPGTPVYVARVGPALGAHAGPGAMGVVVRQA
ncbi:MAG: DegV family protein [Dehalococcoidia bacterium]|nr:DegV family protein [Dehalococcoidia bacterium]